MQGSLALPDQIPELILLRSLIQAEGHDREA